MTFHEYKTLWEETRTRYPRHVTEEKFYAVNEPMPVFELNLDEHPSRVGVDAAELEVVHLPLLHNWAEQWRQRRGRFIVFLGGPPGSGKTVLAGLWEQLACQDRIGVPVQSLPVDGFHYPNAVLDSQRTTINGVPMPLRRIKGRPETFDLPSLRESLRAIKAGGRVLWPRYDRTRHDPIPGAIFVIAEGILVVEGLYVLLNLPGWSELRAEADSGVFLECPEEVFRADVIARKHQQGRCYEHAAAHYDLVDHFAWQIITQYRHGTDTVIRVGAGRRCQLACLGQTEKQTTYPLTAVQANVESRPDKR